MRKSKLLGCISDTALILTPVSALFAPGRKAHDHEWVPLTFTLTAVGLTLSHAAASAKRVEDRVDHQKREVERMDLERLEQARAYKDEQHRLIAAAEDSNSKASDALRRLPIHLEAAEEFLRQSEAAWEQRLFYSFWISLQRSTLKLKDFQDDVMEIHSLSKRYSDSVAKCDQTSPPFSVSEVAISSLESYRAIHDEISTSILRAMGDIEFAKEAIKHLQSSDCRV